MSNFANNPFDLNDFHRQQARYYGLRTFDNVDDSEAMSETSSPQRSAPSPPVKNGSVKSGASDPNMTGAFPAMRTQRRPVPPPEEPTPGAQSPQSVRRRPVNPQSVERKPLRETPANEPSAAPVAGPSRPRLMTPDGQRMNIIYTRPDGRFDTSTIKQEPTSKRYTPPASPIVSTPSRPSSRGSFFGAGKGRKRANSNASVSSTASKTSIKDTLKSAGRRMSDWMSHQGTIVSMSQHDREEWLTEKKSLNKNKGAGDSVAVEEISGQHSQTVIDHSRSNEQLNRLHNSDNSPNRLPLADLTLSGGKGGEARKHAQAFHPSRFREEVGELSAAPTLSKGTAPRGEMQHCNRCRRPMFGPAPDGLCEPCSAYVKERDSRASSTVSHSSEASEYGEPPANHEYMRLAGKKKLRRVRETMYEDPGNPFDDEDDVPNIPGFQISFESKSEGSVRTVREVRRKSGATDVQSNVSSSLLTGSPFDGPEALKSPESASDTPASSFATANATRRALPQHHSAPTVITTSDRSMSVGVLPEPADEIEEYVHPRAQWRRESTPAHRLPQTTRQGRPAARDTKFYGFYDDILESYNANKASRL